MTETIAHRHSSTGHSPAGHAPAAHPSGGDAVQHHPLRVYFVVWAWLFVLSACSYAVDLVGFEGLLKWSLIVLFMLLKAGLIIAVFMHMVWERLALSWAILLPPLALLVFVAIMGFESDYTYLSRLTFFD